MVDAGPVSRVTSSTSAPALGWPARAPIVKAFGVPVGVQVVAVAPVDSVPSVVRPSTESVSLPSP